MTIDQLDPFRERYLNDPRIHAVVNMLLREIVSEDMTAHDVARCAVLAAQIYAERYSAPLQLVLR